MNPAIKAKIIEQLSEMERLLFSLHRNTEGREHNELGYAYMSVREARQALDGHLPCDEVKANVQSEPRRGDNLKS